MQTLSQPDSISLYEVIARIESRNSLTALRFEPGVWARSAMAPTEVVEKIQKIHSCSHDTARAIYSMSWGAIQMMGFNLYGLGYNYSVFAYCASEADQQRVFKTFLQKHGIDFAPIALANSPSTRHKFATLYNGSDNYLGPLVESLRHFGFSVAV